VLLVQVLLGPQELGCSEQKPQEHWPVPVRQERKPVCSLLRKPD
jgi:hypothetical protein